VVNVRFVGAHALLDGELRDDVLCEIGALDAFAHLAGDRVRYVKPHGALYNVATVDNVRAGAVDLAKRVRDGLVAAGLRLAPFASG
jgi:lactam utilization protein B